MESNILLVIIIILFLYIVVLHYIIYKKTNEIKSILFKLSENEKFQDKDFITNYLKAYLEGISGDHKKIKTDYIKHEDIQNFIYEDTKSCRTYIHYTSSEQIAQKIVKEGFKFADTFHKTAESVNQDSVELLYKHSLRKLYGNCVVVICVNNKIFEYYLNELKIKKKDNIISVEQVMVDKPPEINENDEETYLFPNKYVKGYFNYETGQIFRNEEFNPEYDSKKFIKNLERI
ncbi:MAG: hypothetical protein JXB17_13400 [Bacteroidales bacterium]|nr:hypothetical protein [Bacteroidales bacterium]